MHVTALMDTLVYSGFLFFRKKMKVRKVKEGRREGRKEGRKERMILGYVFVKYSTYLNKKKDKKLQVCRFKRIIKQISMYSSPRPRNRPDASHVPTICTSPCSDIYVDPIPLHFFNVLAPTCAPLKKTLLGCSLR